MRRSAHKRVSRTKKPSLDLRRSCAYISPGRKKRKMKREPIIRRLKGEDANLEPKEPWRRRQGLFDSQGEATSTAQPFAHQLIAYPFVPLPKFATFVLMASCLTATTPGRNAHLTREADCVIPVAPTPRSTLREDVVGGMLDREAIPEGR